MSTEMNNFEGEAVKPTGNQSAPSAWGSEGLDDSNGKAVINTFKAPVQKQPEKVKEVKEVKPDLGSMKPKRDPNNPDDGWSDEFSKNADTKKDIYEDIRSEYTTDEIELINAGATLPEIDALRKHNAKINGEVVKEEEKLIDDKFEDFDKVKNSANSLREKMGITDDGIDINSFNEDNLLKYYKSLESQFSKNNNETKNLDETKIEEPVFKFDPTEITVDKITDYMKSDSLSETESDLFNKYSKTVLENGGVLPDSVLAEIAEQEGVSVGMMKHYIESKVKEVTDFETKKQNDAFNKIEFDKQEVIKQQQVKMDKAINYISENVGSIEDINKAITWGSENLSEYQQNVLSRDLQNPDTVTDASREVLNLFNNSQISNDDPIYGKSTQSTPQKDSNVYSDYSEYDKATDNPLYHTDMSYKQSVMNKLQKSNYKDWVQFR